MRVLIVKASALGDVVHALPVLAWIKSADAASEIDWLVEAGFAPLLENHPLIGKIHRIDTKSWRRQGKLAGLSAARETIRALRAEHYDVVLDLQGNSKSGFFTLFSGARRRYGFDRAAVREWPNLLATTDKVALGEAEHHISERSLAVARGAFPDGEEAPAAGPLPVAEEEKRKISEMLRSRGLGARPLVVFHYGTTWSTKLWSLENWQELARRVGERESADLVLTWGNDEEKRAAETIAAASSDRAFIWPRGTLRELTALLARADLVVGGDTGPIHIAAAVGTPTVSLFRVTDASRNGPRGETHLRLQAPLECSPCLRKECERDVECGLSISVDTVADSVGGLLGQSF